MYPCSGLCTFIFSHSGLGALCIHVQGYSFEPVLYVSMFRAVAWLLYVSMFGAIRRCRCCVGSCSGRSGPGVVWTVLAV